MSRPEPWAVFHSASGPVLFSRQPPARSRARRPKSSPRTHDVPLLAARYATARPAPPNVRPWPQGLCGPHSGGQRASIATPSSARSGRRCGATMCPNSALRGVLSRNLVDQGKERREGEFTIPTAACRWRRTLGRRGSSSFRATRRPRSDRWPRSRPAPAHPEGVCWRHD